MDYFTGKALEYELDEDEDDFEELDDDDDDDDDQFDDVRPFFLTPYRDNIDAIFNAGLGIR